MTQAEVLQVFRDTGALLEGHFVLRSGLHSRQFFQCALVLQQMPIVEKLGAALADQVRPLGATTVIAPAMGGLVIGQEVARQLGARFIFAEKEEGRLVLRRGFKLAPAERILVVEDVVTQGGRVRETLDIVRVHGGGAVGVAILVDRDLGTTNSCMAVMEGGEPWCWKTPKGARTTPSVVAFPKAASASSARPPSARPSPTRQHIFSIKRFMGRKFDEVTEADKRMPYKSSKPPTATWHIQVEVDGEAETVLARRKSPP
jgi:orotate phosphoribosyltransferase